MTENKYLKWLITTDSIFWIDNAVYANVEEALANGATGATTNPFLINAALKNDAEFWNDKLPDASNMSKDERGEAFTKCIVEYYANKFKEMHDKNPSLSGYICAQTNPNKTGDAQYMIEQAKAYAAIAPNVAVKLPATKAGLEAYEECAALGINVVATLSMTVPQVLAAGEAAKRGKERAIKNGIKPGLSVAVLMVGRLNNYLRDVAEDSKIDVKESDIIQAGTACIKRAYNIFQERNYDTYIMPAGSFHASNITDIAGAKMIMSIAPWIADLLKEETVFEERINIPVEEDVINRLMQIDEFKRAYDPNGLKEEEFITFGGNNRTTAQYIECGWNLI